MTKHRVPSFDYHFQKGPKKKKKTFRWITPNPETTWRAELKIKEEAKRPENERKEKSKRAVEGNGDIGPGEGDMVSPSRPGRIRSGQQ